MSKLTKGQKNEIKRQEYLKRVSDINKFGFTIVEHVNGDRRHSDSYTYYLHKDGILLHPGRCYNSSEALIEIANCLINNPTTDEYKKHRMIFNLIEP